MQKILQIGDTILTQQQLNQYIEKFSADNVITQKSNTNTYPILRLKDNYKYISLIYTLLLYHIKIGIPIHPAGEWLLDNFYIIEKTTKSIPKELSKSKYINLPALSQIVSNNNITHYQKTGFARIYILANLIISNTDGKIEHQNLEEQINSYQKQNKLKMDEICLLPVFLQICLIEKIRKICEKIFLVQTERYKTNNKIEKIDDMQNYDIAIKTLSMKNSITSLIEITRIDFLSLFQNTNYTEKILLKDPAKVYSIMDEKTKTYYRQQIKNISKITNKEEEQVALKVVELCQNNSTKKSHVGYYLIDEGKEKLLQELGLKNNFKISKQAKQKIYISSIYIISFILTLILTFKISVISILFFIPIQNAITQIIQYILSKTVKPKPIPKIDLHESIPKEYTTMCIIPVILENENKVKKMMQKLEVYYLANKSQNLYFTLLGDCTSSSNEKLKEDEKIIEAGKQITKELNEKYGEIFNFCYRKRTWSSSEKCFMGYERKRGMINEFNEFLKIGKSNFRTNTIVKIPKIKYIITIDEDTNLTLNSVFKLVGTMAHILNKPEIDKFKNIVTKGYGIIQPQISIDIESANKSLFSKIFSENKGYDLYTNIFSNVYQDNFGEAIYEGKGIYDLNVFYKVLNKTIPENKVLSHDLLEGSFLRCGYATDIILLDNFPSNYLSYKVRFERWLRGDIQLLYFLKSKINILSKYKIIDNIIKSTNEIFIFITLLLGLVLKNANITIISFLLFFTPMNVVLIENFINAKFKNYKTFTKQIGIYQQAILKQMIKLITLPSSAFLEVTTFIKTIYRMYFSHQNLLQWKTSNEIEIKTNKIEKNKKEKITKFDKNYLMYVAENTWKFFKENSINFLPIDNYQEDRKNKKSIQTSPTNIGFYIMSAIASYDLGFEGKLDTINLLENIIDTVEKLPKWNGHLYNWYDVTTLKPIEPFDISSVDSGNFVGHLYCLKQFLIKEKANKNLINKVSKIINETNFEKLYNQKTNLFSIGYSCNENKLYNSYYDLLATEARQTSLVAIAKRDIPAKHFKKLSRLFVEHKKYLGLISWGGTTFEYMMPNINIPTYRGTILDESCKFAMMSNIDYAKKLEIPFGMSESGFSVKDLQGNYQYKTFGIPWLGLKRGLKKHIVISPYSSALFLNINVKKSVFNLRRLQALGLFGKYGFYEAIDFIPKKQIVKSYMAHHQGMILTSIDNCLNENIFRKRFMQNPEMQAIKILLEETISENAIVSKSKKEKIEKIKEFNFEKNLSRNSGVNLLSSKNLSTISKSNELEKMYYTNIQIHEGTNIFIKNIDTEEIYNFKKILKENQNLKINFESYKSEIQYETGNFLLKISTVMSPNSEVEIKKIKIENKQIEDINLEIYLYQEPILYNETSYQLSPSFNKMFLKYNFNQNILSVERKVKNANEKNICVSETIFPLENELEFEIDKEKISKRNNKCIPNLIEKSMPMSSKIETTINPIILLKQTLKIAKQKTKQIYFLTSVSENQETANQNIKQYMDVENLNRVFEISKSYEYEKNRYENITENDVIKYQNLLNKILQKPKYNVNGLDLKDNYLWKYQISGDYNMLTINVTSQTDKNLISDICKAYKYLKSKNYNFDLIFLTDVNIDSIIYENKMQQYLNQRGGIFILNNIPKEDKKVIVLRSNYTID